MSTIIDYNGKLAVDFGGWMTNWSKPQMDRALVVSNVNASDYPHLMGASVEFEVNIGKVWAPGFNRPTWIDTTDWEHVTETKPIKKPRKGKDYDWEWFSGRWQKTWR